MKAVQVSQLSLKNHRPTQEVSQNLISGTFLLNGFLSQYQIPDRLGGRRKKAVEVPSNTFLRKSRQFIFSRTGN